MRKKGKIPVKDGAKDKLIDLFKVISWLDDKRWNQIERPDPFVEIILKDKNLQPAQKVLVHWLTYITNRVKDADALWENNPPIIKNLVREYEDCSSVSGVSGLCKEFLDVNSKEKRILALPADLESIRRTLVILLDKRYEKNIIQFTTEKISEWGTENLCSRVAFRLYLLSYKNVGRLAKSNELRKKNRREIDDEIQKAKDVLKDEDEFKKEYREWLNKRWHKRLWAALRDYKKYEPLPEIFIKGIEKNKQGLWKENFNKEQLELPGDVWNNKPSFRNNIFAELIEEPPKSWEMPRIVRQLYDQLKEANKVPSNFSPEQFDVTFDFVPRMCEKRLCKVCPFGEDGAKSICNPGTGKYCPVALFTCGYIVECEEKGCVIKKGVGKGICRGRREAGVSK